MGGFVPMPICRRWAAWRIRRKVPTTFEGRVFVWRTVGMEAGINDYVEVARCHVIDAADVYVVAFGTPIGEVLKTATERLAARGCARLETDESKRREAIEEGAKLRPELMLFT